jgi:hypothetical protein
MIPIVQETDGIIPIVHDFKALLADYGHLTVSDLALLSLVSEGVDHRSALVQASGMPERTVYRRIDALSSKPRWRDGKISGKFHLFPPLVQSRRHPHEQGLQYALTAEGHKLLKSFVTARA